MQELDHNHHIEFAKSKSVPWLTLDGKLVAGEVRTAGGKGFSAGNVTFVQVYDAGYVANGVSSFLCFFPDRLCYF